MVNTTYEPFSRQSEYIDVNRGFIRSLDLHHCDTLLDLACGTGTLGDLLRETYCMEKITGLDLSEESLHLAQEHFADSPPPVPSFVLGTADCLPFLDHRFQAVIMGNSIHNLPDQDRLLQEIGRVLVPGGIFAFNTSFFAGTFPPGTEVLYHEWLKIALHHIKEQDERRRQQGEPGIHRQRKTSHRAFSRKWPTPDEWTELLDRNGFSVKWFCHRTIMLNQESLRMVGAYAGMAKVLLSGYPVDVASAALDASVEPAFALYGRPAVKRLWLEVVAEKR
jgi:ubiquinone/menaquinone biosynthesis C-methylase UbiE